MYIFLGELSFTSTNNQKAIRPIIGDTDFAVAADGSFVRTADLGVMPKMLVFGGVCADAAKIRFKAKLPQNQLYRGGLA